MSMSPKRANQLHHWTIRATPEEQTQVIGMSGVNVSYFRRLMYGYIPEPNRKKVQMIVDAIQEFNASLDQKINGTLPHVEMSDFEFPGDE